MSSQRNILSRAFVSELRTRLREKSPLIQVLLGPRQVGKTTGLGIIEKYFEKDLHYANADEALSHSSLWIDEQWQKAKLMSDTPILVIDEVQKILQWSEHIKALWDHEKRNKKSFRLILSSSSSLSLTAGLEESLAGRFEIIPVYHWSYVECKKHFNFTLDQYLLFGGYPESVRFIKNFKRWQNYLKQSIIETVIGKDILRLASVKKPALFRQAFEVISSYPAQEVSLNKILGQLQEGGNVDLVKHYLTLFEGAFLFKTIQKYSPSSISQKSSSPKIIPLCPALYSYKLGLQDLTNSELRGHIFEACVGAEFVKLQGQLFYWREGGDFEVDFIYQNGTLLYAIEVKSGRKRNTKGMVEFVNRNPKAKAVFITSENFESFVKDPEGFLLKVS